MRNKATKSSVLPWRPKAKRFKGVDKLEVMEWRPYPVSYYVQEQCRKYYSTGDQVQDMFWEPYAGEHLVRAWWMTLHTSHLWLVSRNVQQPTAPSQTTTAGHVPNGLHSHTHRSTDQIESMDWQ